MRPVVGPYRSSRFLLNVAKKLHGVPRATVLNGQPATIFVDGDAVVATLVLDIMDGSIVGVRSVTNPDKLARLTAQLVLFRAERTQQARVRPRIMDNSELNEQTELVGSDPFPDDLPALEVHDGDRPLLHGSPRRGPAHVSAGIGTAEEDPQDDRVVCHDQLLDVQAEIGERFPAAPDRFGPGLRSRPEGVLVVLAVEIGGPFVMSAVPDLVNEPPHLRFALGNFHRSRGLLVGRTLLGIRSFSDPFCQWAPLHERVTSREEGTDGIRRRARAAGPCPRQCGGGHRRARALSEQPRERCRR